MNGILTLKILKEVTNQGGCGEVQHLIRTLFRYDFKNTIWHA
jgi:hypothetical protein